MLREYFLISQSLSFADHDSIDIWIVNADGDNYWNSMDDWLWQHINGLYDGIYSLRGYNELSNNEIDEASEHDTKLTYRFGLNAGYDIGEYHDVFITTQWFEFSIIICSYSDVDLYQLMHFG